MEKKVNYNGFDHKVLQQNLNLVIAELGISKSEFCRRLGLTSRTSVTNRFRGKGWKLEEMLKCADLAGKPVEVIFFGKLSANVDNRLNNGSK